MTTVKVQSICS